MNAMKQQLYIYTYGYRPEETELFHLETRTFFGQDTNTPFIISPIEVHPDRSPFLRERLDVINDGDELTELLEQVTQLKLNNQSFKVIFLKTNDLEGNSKIS